VPANSNSNQRFLTVEPFLQAGFSVLGLLNEPSAASIEYGHRSRSADTREQVLVYDLGGGTFDASLVSISGRAHFVTGSEGVADVGGDDFDIILADMALDAAGILPESLTQAELFRLHEECRHRKESLHPNTRRIVVDFGVVREGWLETTVSAADYYERCRPPVQRTVAATESLLARAADGGKPDALYVTGGGSELPLVARMLREVFGRRVKRSAYTRAATAIGLAIQADAEAEYVLHESFTRHFGVWREWDAGRSVSFDSLFDKGTPLPVAGHPPEVIVRRYCPAHNAGHFRYLECSHRSEEGRPSGDITVWDEIRFPFDPALRDMDLAAVPVTHTGAVSGELIEERYECDAAGVVTVRISNLTSGYGREYRLGRWSGKTPPILPHRKRKAVRA
jgi:molecular chaperone DnaK (HSP70)